MPLSEQEVVKFLKDYQEAYEEGDERFFDFFAEDASFFTYSSPTRIDSVEEFKRGFGPHLASGQTRRNQFLSPEIKISGDVAIVSLHNRIQVDGSTTNARASLVIVKDGERRGARITHLHVSPLAAPTPVGVARSIEEITLLEERVAVAAATVGTPK
jgi:ketosteroid isomerase-like protein